MREMEIYVHIPFCVQKCSYCDFLSMPADDDVKKQYIGRLKEEIRQMSEEYPGRPVKSVFFGGGTPSILPGSVITGIMDCIRENFQIQSGAEITIECNPGTLDVSRLTQYKKAGINRLSLGLQSADDKELKLLGRIHTYEDFLKSFDCARKCGFDNINVDVMSGLPTQKLKSWEQTLKKVTGLKPEHISAYGLIVEEGTPFWKIYGYDEETRRKGEQPLFLPSEEEERQMYAFTVEYLGKKGYERYEISNYARPGHQCIHNRGYWDRSDYLGVGLGASSMMDNCRFSNTGSMEKYLKGRTLEGEKYRLSRREQMEEFMFLGMRMTEGISRTDFLKDFQVTVDFVYGDILKKLEQEGLVRDEKGRICLTDRGIDVSNYVFSQFLMDEEE